MQGITAYRSVTGARGASFRLDLQSNSQKKYCRSGLMKEQLYPIPSVSWVSYVGFPQKQNWREFTWKARIRDRGEWNREEGKASRVCTDGQVTTVAHWVFLWGLWKEPGRMYLSMIPLGHLCVASVPCWLRVGPGGVNTLELVGCISKGWTTFHDFGESPNAEKQKAQAWGAWDGMWAACTATLKTRWAEGGCSMGQYLLLWGFSSSSQQLVPNSHYGLDLGIDKVLLQLLPQSYASPSRSTPAKWQLAHCLLSFPLTQLWTRVLHEQNQ